MLADRAGVFSLVDVQPDFWVIDKKAGIDMHTVEGVPGLVRLLQQDNPGEGFFPVHRLDKETSGLVLLARSAEAARSLSRLFSQRHIEKYYFALCSRKPNKKQGCIRGDMQKARGGSWKLAKTTENPAVTCFFSTTFVADQSALNGSVIPKRFLLLRPFTGKTHQLRVAMKSQGAAILGDKRYGGMISDRLYLHAACLRFSYQGADYCYQQMPDQGQWFAQLDTAVDQQFTVSPENLPWPTPSIQGR